MSFLTPSRCTALLLACFAVGLFHFQGVFGIGLSAKDLLVQNLLKDYHASVEPSGVIDLRFGLALMCVHFDKATYKLKTVGWERYTWTDVRLSWNPKDFDGIKKLRLPPSLVWKPDIVCYNALEAEARSNENAVIESDGTVTWVPRAFYKTLCTVEEEKPVCELSFGSWTYDQWSMSLEIDNQGVDITPYMNATCPWSVENYTASIKATVYPCCKEAYNSLDIVLNLKPTQAEVDKKLSE